MADRNDEAVLECGDAVRLRPAREADARSIAEHANNRKVWINLRDGLPHPYTIDDARAWIQSQAWQNPRVSFAIDVEGQAIGGIGLVLGTDIERRSAEVGYWLGEAFWNRGIATVALARLCRYAFEELGLLRVFATPIVWNPASCRVLEKAGFQREGIMRNACIKDGKVADMALYARVRSDDADRS